MLKKLLMKKDIFYYSSGFPPENTAVAVRNYWMSKVMQDAGHRVDLHTNRDFFFKQGSNKEHVFVRIAKELLAGVELFIRVIFSKKDYYYFSSPPFLTVIAGIFACILKRKKYIFDIRDVYPQVVFSLGILKKDSLIGKFFMWLAQQAYKNAHAVITVTVGFRKTILNMCPSANVQLIYNGYDPELFRPNQNKFEDFTVVFHGNLGKFQRIDMVRKAAEEIEKDHPDIHFVVIGSGPGDKDLENPPRNLQFLGPMIYEDIAKYISRCHVGISFRSDDEFSKDVFPVKVFEYVGVGIPVVISPPGEASEFIKNNNLGKEVENDIEQIKTAILSYTSEKPDRFGDFFSRKKQCEKVLDLLI